MSAIARVRNKQIDTGKIINILVQAENNAEEILFHIEGEPELVTDFASLAFYLLYTRPGDTVPSIVLLEDASVSDGVITVPFTPTSYFTANDGTVKIQLLISDIEVNLSVNDDGTIDGSTLWQTFPAFLFVAASQLNATETIIEENVLTKYLSGVHAQALKTEGYAAGTQNGVDVGSGSPYYNNNAKYYKSLAKDWAMKTGGPVEGVEMSAKVYAASSQNYATESQQWANKMDGKVLGTDYSAKYYAGEASDSAYAAGQSAESAAASAQIVEDHAEAIEAIADDLTNIDSVAGKLTEIGTVAGDLANIDAVAGNKTNIDAVNANKTNIDTVAGKTTEITTVAGKANDVTTVAGIASDVTKVAAVDDDVSAVAAIDSDVSAVAAAASDVTAVSGALSDISDVATDLNDDDSAIRAVAADMTGVSAVAADLANIDAVAADLANIDNAEANALKAEGWANGTQNGTPVSSDSPYYENNAKYWADAVPDLKSAISFNRKRIENLEQKSGSVVDVDYPDYSVYGEVPTGKAKNAIVSKMRGVSVAWNQLITNGTFETTTGWNAWGGSIAGATDNTLEVNVTATNSYGVSISCNLGSPTVLGHKCLVSFRVKVSDYTKVKGSKLSRPFQQGVTFSDNNWMTFNAIAEVTYATGFEFQIGSTDGTLKAYFQDVSCSDITQDFGSQVADYLYSIEQATTGAGVALFRALVSAQDNSHETGSMVSTTYEAVKSKKDFFDQQMELGKYNNETGAKESDSNRLRTVNRQSCTPNTTYYFDSPTNAYGYGYDANGNYLGSFFNMTANSNFTTPNNCHSFAFYVTTQYGTTYGNDIHIIGELDSLPLPTSVTLRGILKVVNNALTVDGDEYDPETGDIDRNHGIVTIDGSDDEGWYKSSNVFISNGIDVSDALSTNWWSPSLAVSNLLSRGVCVDYNSYDSLPFALTMVSGKIRLHISECENMTETDFKDWLSDNNIQLQYKKATPTSDTPVTPVLDPTLATEGGGTLSTTQTNDPAIVSALEMTYLTL